MHGSERVLHGVVGGYRVPVADGRQLRAVVLFGEVPRLVARKHIVEIIGKRLGLFGVELRGVLAPVGVELT